MLHTDVSLFILTFFRQFLQQNSFYFVKYGKSYHSFRDQETNISEFQYDLDYCQVLYYEPLARVIAQALPVFDVKFTFTGTLYDSCVLPNFKLQQIPVEILASEDCYIDLPEIGQT